MLISVAFRYAGIALQFLILVVVARGTSVADYGRYLFVLSAVLPTYFVVGLGASEAFVREAPARGAGEHGETRRMAGSVLLVMMATLVLVTGAVVATIVLQPGTAKDATTGWFMLAFFAGNGIMFNAAQLLLGAGRNRLAAFFFYPAVNLSLLASSVPYVLLAPAPVFAGIAVWTSVGALAAAAVSLACVIVLVRPARPSLAYMRLLVGTGVRLALARALYAIGLWLPTFMAGLLLSKVDAGYLGTAGRLAVAVAAVTAAVRFAIRPAIVRAYAGDDMEAIKRICGTAATATLALVLVSLAGNLLVGRLVIGFALGTELASAAPLLSILLVGIAIEAFAGPIDEVMKMTGNDTRLLGMFAVAVPMLALALWFASHVGVVAMAVAQVVYTTLLFCGMILAVHRSLGIWLHPILPIWRCPTPQHDQ